MKPKLFIGCSQAGTLWGEFFQSQLTAVSEVTLINQGVLTASQQKLKMLKRHIEECDFALLVVTNTDRHDPPNYANILVLIGLCIGELGHSRTFILQSQGSQLPDYLEGFTPLLVDDGQDAAPLAELAGPHLYPIKLSMSQQKKRFKASDMRKNEAIRSFLFDALDSLSVSSVDYDRVLDKFHKTFDTNCGIIELQEVTAATLFELRDDGVTLQQFGRAGQVSNNHSFHVNDANSYLAECYRSQDTNIILGRAKDKEDGEFEYIYCVKLHPTIVSSIHFKTRTDIPPRNHHQVMMELSEKNAKLVSSLKSIVKGRMLYAEAHEESS
ncbi:nucleotide-binding protein [Paenibacillus sp. HWE-109]|uniref:TIR domain-containing protein n=1 Tax=Paenibacillus sp. HWE-109 TaxID=1306526 RepID=UPI001EDEAC5E|nr:TIR domain-containing protein [Paenibacillus sp. HWE-109]UKS30387.1 nucleotide-binding protein [Paenibacillus sp. HWE-109]